MKILKDTMLEVVSGGGGKDVMSYISSGPNEGALLQDFDQVPAADPAGEQFLVRIENPNLAKGIFPGAVGLDGHL